MKKKLLFTAIPIIISIVGIIYFQVDWVIKTYKYESNKLNKLADESLKKALLEIDLAQADSISKVMLPKFSKLADSVGIEMLGPDTLIIKLRKLKNEDSRYYADTKVYNVDRVQIEFPSYTDFVDNTKNIKNLNFISDKAITDMLDEVILPYIKTQDSLSYKSDSIKIQQNLEKNLSAYGVKNMENLTQLVFQSRVEPSEKQLLLGTFFREYKPQGLNRYVGTKRWVGIYFHGHADYILSKMLLGVCLSILLMLIMIVSFIYLVKLILQQKKLAEMKDDFINNLTHEFKTPIATIAVTIEGMQNFNALNDPEKTKRYLAISKNELNRLNQMVSNVLNVASHEKRSVELNISEINLTEMVQEVIGLEHFRATKEVKFVLSIAEEANYLRVDPLHFKNVLINLVDNAVKYAHDKVEITLTAIKQNNNLQFVIKDNGIGIPTSQLKYVFDKFYRVPTGNIYNVKGIGLGLSYVKSIVAAHKGIITLDSEINLGTTFTILIPLS